MLFSLFTAILGSLSPCAPLLCFTFNFDNNVQGAQNQWPVAAGEGERGKESVGGGGGGLVFFFRLCVSVCFFLCLCGLMVKK